jgi:hypothetical protein
MPFAAAVSVRMPVVAVMLTVSVPLVPVSVRLSTKSVVWL